VKAPFDIDVIWFKDRSLYATLKWSIETLRIKSNNQQCCQIVESREGAVRYRCDFVSKQAPVDDTRIMHKYFVQRIQTTKQIGHAAESSEGAVRYRCDCVPKQVSAYDNWMKH
jgi:hypothetical protein